MGTRAAIIHITDPHCGGSTGLFPPEGVVTDDGQLVMPSEWQQWMWPRWEDSFARADELTRGCRRFLVWSGDCVDGMHHQTFQTVSANPEIQKRIFFRCARPALALNPERLLFVRGTEAHVGQQANIEEGIARELGAHQDLLGNYSHWNYYGTVAGLTLKVFHHGSIGNLPWTEQGSLHRMAWRVRTVYDRAGLKPPDLVLTGHRHAWGDSGEFACPTRVLMGPGWQGATSYVHKIDGAAAGLVPVGIWVILIEDGKPPVCIPIRHEIRRMEPDVLG